MKKMMGRMMRKEEKKRGSLKLEAGSLKLEAFVYQVPCFYQHWLCITAAVVAM